MTTIPDSPSTTNRAPRRSRPATVIALTVLFALLTSSTGAQVKPGDVITADDADKVKGLVSPGVHWLVRRGMNMRIIEHEPPEMPPKYREATEKYASQVRLTPDGVLDESTYVAGRPFPVIDPEDPHAATKIMYNYERTQYFTDDLTLKLADAETGGIHGREAGKQTYEVERHFVLESLRILKYIGRTENPPIPVMNNPERVLAKTGQYPILEPYDLRGVGGLSYRYLDPKRFDDTWLYLPSLRRVRRLSSAQRSDALFGQDIDIDSYGGYAGQIPWFEFRLLSVEEGMLAAYHGDHLPPVPCKEDGGVTFCDNWEPLPKVYVIEGRPNLDGYAYLKRIIYVDGENFYIPYTDMYDPAGELWKTAINFIRHDRRPNPGVAYDYDRPRDFIYGFVMVDIQLEHGTRAAIPGMGFLNEAGWYINQGDAMEVGEDWFTIGAMIAAGR